MNEVQFFNTQHKYDQLFAIRSMANYIKKMQSGIKVDKKELSFILDVVLSKGNLLTFEMLNTTKQELQEAIVNEI